MSYLQQAITAKRGGLPTSKKDAYVYLLAGQSNAQGYSDDSAMTTLYRSLIPRTWVYFKPGAYTDPDSTYSPDNGQWQPLLYGANHSLSDYLDHFGPELEFCYQMQNYLNREIFLVKAAWGDSSLAQESTFGTPGQGGFLDWDKNSTTPTEYYNRLINYYALPAMRDLRTAGYNPILKSFLWMQGERDAFVTAFGTAYQVNLQNLLINVRGDLSAPTMQCVIGRISDEVAASRSAGGPAIRSAQQTVGTQTNNVWFSTDAYTMKVDLVHYANCNQMGNDWYLAARSQ